MAPPTEPDFSSHVLGRTRDPVQLDTSVATRAALLAMLGQARHRVDIVSRELESAIYDRPDVGEAVRRLVVRSRRARVRVLARDVSRAVATGHRLIHLARRLSSFVQIRRLAPEHRDFNSALVMVDATGTIVRRFADRYEGEASFADPMQTRELTRRFDEMWDVAVEDPDLRAFHI